MATLLAHARTARPTQLARLFIGALLLLIVGAVAEDLLEKVCFTFEVPLLRWIHQFATLSLDHLALDLSLVGGVSVIAPLSAVVLTFLWWKCHSLAYFWALSVGEAAVLNLIMKLAFHRTRPELWLRLVQESDASFPSGHSMSSTAFVVATILTVWCTPYRFPALIVGLAFTLSIRLSRLYLGITPLMCCAAGCRG